MTEPSIVFEKRELTPFAEPVSTSKLKEGSVYFAVNFVDDEMRIPIVETLVFIGRDGTGVLRFQDVESFRQGVRFETATDDDHAIFFQCPEDHANHIFEYEHALEALMRCSLRRRELGR